MKVSPQVSFMNHNTLIFVPFSSSSVISRLEILPMSTVEPSKGLAYSTLKDMKYPKTTQNELK